MNYTIKYAMSARHPELIVDLNREGNTTSVVVWHRGEHRTIRKRTFKSYEEAEATFDSWCEEFEITAVKETQLDPSDLYANYD